MNEPIKYSYLFIILSRESDWSCHFCPFMYKISLHQVTPTSDNKQKCILSYLTQRHSFQFYDTLPNFEQLNLKSGILDKFLKQAIVVPAKQDEEKEETVEGSLTLVHSLICWKCLHKLLCNSNSPNTYSHLYYILRFFKRHWLWNWRNKLH